MTAKSYSILTTPISGTTQTGLDQLISFSSADPGLHGNTNALNLQTGLAAADQLNKLIIEAAKAVGAASDGVFTVDEVIAMNTYIRQNHLTEWATWHGNDSGDIESGFHFLQNDGAVTQYRGNNLVDTVVDGIFHLGFEIQNGQFLNEDGTANATVDQVAGWLTQFYTDHSNSNTALDRITDAIMADPGLAARIPEADIEAGANAANGLNLMIKAAMNSTGVAADGWISETDVLAINSYIRADTTRLAQWTVLHGDDETALETGYHLVQNDGATTPTFAKNLVNTVADGIYHMGFEVVNGRFLNEDGNANASVADVSSWLNYFLSDQSTTGTGLDLIVDTIKIDPGLSRWTPAADINAGADYANQLNQIILSAVQATNAMADQWITVEDLRAMNTWIRSDATRLATWTALHGDDETGVETGYHLVQNDNGTTTYFGKNLINTVADGIYHMGFDIQNDRFLNEDGNANASLNDVANWLNYFYRGTPLVLGTSSAEIVAGSDVAEELVGNSGDDVISAGGGDDLISGGWGNDNISGGEGNDLIYANWGDDTVNGGNGSDVYRVTGNVTSSFGGYDSYVDSGSSGTDKIEALGAGDVDVGMKAFSGIEVIDGRGATGTVRLLGSWTNDTLDFRGTSFIGSHFIIDGGAGADTLYGSLGDDVLLSGGGGDDNLDGYAGSDTYQVTGNVAAGWANFSGFDSYSDSGDKGTDKIVALGVGDVDVGLKSFGADSGIEVIDGSGATGTVRLLGNWTNDILDFRNTSFVGTNIVIDGGAGADSLYGTVGSDVLLAGGGDDSLDGVNGSDSYRVTGNTTTGFNGYDIYADTGTSGTDKIVALGAGDVDIGLKSFGVANGIEVVDASGATGTVRLLGNWTSDILDFRSTSFIGTNIVIDGGTGADSLYGTVGNDVLIAGGSDDSLDGVNGSDTYRVTGNTTTGFNGYDIYADTGVSGTDKIVALGTGNVDIGIKTFSGIEVIDGSGATGTVRLLGNWTNDILDFRNTSFVGTNIVIDGGAGADSLYGTVGSDVLLAGGGDDSLDGVNGSDSYRVTGNTTTGFNGYDIYADTGTSGTDKIVALGAGDVDIGLKSFGAANGIEVVDASGATGTVRLLGNWTSDILDFRSTSFIGTNIVIDGGTGADSLYGTVGNDVLIAGGSDDSLDGVNGSDTYRVTGNTTTGFNGYDIYADTGVSGTDKIVALGTGNVDIGIKTFSGIEVVDASGATGTVRLLGNWTDDILDFRNTTFIGTNIVIDGGTGADNLYGTVGNDVLIGGSSGSDNLDGGNGSDTYRVTGNVAAGWASFSGYDSYTDTGSSGSDKIVALGAGDVDIGLKIFSGIDVVDGSGATGTVRLLGTGADDVLDFRNTSFVGSNIVIDGGTGADSLYGTAGNDVLLSGGGGADNLDGSNGSDTYRVTGNATAGWTSFSGYDNYVDSGTSGTDKIVALGVGDVDIGLKSFNAASGIEVIDGSGASGAVRLLGNWTDDVLDFRGTTIIGSNVLIDGGNGKDILVGSTGADVVLGGSGNDIVIGNAGADKLDGGTGDDLLVDTQASLSGTDLLVGGDGRDRIVLGHHDNSTVDVYGGSQTTLNDGYADCFTLMNAASGLDLKLVVHGFEQGRDILDFSQLRDAAGLNLGLDDLLISYNSGNANISFASGVKTVAGGNVDVQIEVIGVVGTFNNFAFTSTQVSSSFINPSLADAYLS